MLQEKDRQYNVIYGKKKKDKKETMVHKTLHRKLWIMYTKLSICFYYVGHTG